MIDNILEILMVVVLVGIATYDTLKSRRKDSVVAQEESGIFDIVR